MNIQKALYPTKIKLISTIGLFLLGLLLQTILAVMFVSFDTSQFGSFLAGIVIPFMWIFFWPTNLLINLVIQEWWILVVYSINILYLYFIVCFFASAYAAFKIRTK